MKYSIKEITNEQLTIVKNRFVDPDKVNLGIDIIGGGFTSTIANKIIDKALEAYLRNPNGIIVLINPVSFHLVKQIIEAGIPVENLRLCFCQFYPIRDKKGTIKDVSIKYKKINELFSMHPILVNNKDLQVITYGDLLKMKTNLLLTNFPYALGNELTKKMVTELDFDQFVSIMPISKYEKDKVFQYIIPGTIDNKVTREASAFAESGGDTYPVICCLSKYRNGTKTFKEFELKYCVNREEGFGKKFFEAQEKRTNTWLEHKCMVTPKLIPTLDSRTSFTSSIWTPGITHGWAAQEIYKDAETKTFKDLTGKGGDYINWNFNKPSCAYSDVFKPTAKGNVNQTVTIFSSEQEKNNFVNWVHSAEMNGKYRHCGLFSILLRWMNKPTGCPYACIIPKVDWTKSWTDEEILKDYGYTDEEIEKVLHYNDDLVPQSWKAPSWAK